MNKVIVVGDTHGRDNWEKLINEDFDKFIFIGDYFDSREGISGDEQIYNFKNIINFKHNHPEKVVLLIGNHDYHYINDNEHPYSNYQAYKSLEIRRVLNENKDKMQMAYSFTINGETFLLTHAGVTKTWCKNNNINIDSKTLSKDINNLWNSDINAFAFYGFDPYGDSKESSPIWVRPSSFINDSVHGYTFMVGHTTQEKVTILKHKELVKDSSNINKYVFLDVPDSYVVIENNEIKTFKFNEKV